MSVLDRGKLLLTGDSEEVLLFDAVLKSFLQVVGGATVTACGLIWIKCGAIKPPREEDVYLLPELILDLVSFYGDTRISRNSSSTGSTLLITNGISTSSPFPEKGATLDTIPVVEEKSKVFRIGTKSTTGGESKEGSSKASTPKHSDYESGEEILVWSDSECEREKTHIEGKIIEEKTIEENTEFRSANDTLDSVPGGNPLTTEISTEILSTPGMSPGFLFILNSHILQNVTLFMEKLNIENTLGRQIHFCLRIMVQQPLIKWTKIEETSSSSSCDIDIPTRADFVGLNTTVLPAFWSKETFNALVLSWRCGLRSAVGYVRNINTQIFNHKVLHQSLKRSLKYTRFYTKKTMVASKRFIRKNRGPLKGIGQSMVQSITNMTNGFAMDGGTFTILSRFSVGISAFCTNIVGKLLHGWSRFFTTCFPRTYLCLSNSAFLQNERAKCESARCLVCHQIIIRPCQFQCGCYACVGCFDKLPFKACPKCGIIANKSSKLDKSTTNSQSRSPDSKKDSRSRDHTGERSHTVERRNTIITNLLENTSYVAPSVHPLTTSVGPLTSVGSVGIGSEPVSQPEVVNIGSASSSSNGVMNLEGVNIKSTNLSIGSETIGSETVLKAFEVSPQTWQTEKLHELHVCCISCYRWRGPFKNFIKDHLLWCTPTRSKLLLRISTETIVGAEGKMGGQNMISTSLNTRDSRLIGRDSIENIPMNYNASTSMGTTMGQHSSGTLRNSIVGATPTLQPKTPSREQIPGQIRRHTTSIGVVGSTRLSEIPPPSGSPKKPIQQGILHRSGGNIEVRARSVINSNNVPQKFCQNYSKVSTEARCSALSSKSQPSEFSSPTPVDDVLIDTGMIDNIIGGPMLPDGSPMILPDGSPMILPDGSCDREKVNEDMSDVPIHMRRSSENLFDVDPKIEKNCSVGSVKSHTTSLIMSPGGKKSIEELLQEQLIEEQLREEMKNKAIQVQKLSSYHNTSIQCNHLNP